MTRLRRFILLLALPATMLAQTALIRPSPRALSTTQRPADTAFWRIDNFGFTSLLYDEKHNGYRYPTYADFNPAGYFIADMHNVGVGDFNGDGRKDMVVAWAIFPHVTAHQTELTLTVLLNDGKGGLAPAAADIWAGPRRNENTSSIAPRSPISTATAVTILSWLRRV